MSLQHYIALVAVGVAVTALLTPLVRRLALRYGLVATPGGRRIHKKPVAEAGGSAMVAGLAAVILFQIAGELLFGWKGFLTDQSFDARMLIGVGVGALVIFGVGFVDDIKDLRPGLKLAGTIVGALIVALSGLRIDFISNPFDNSIILLGGVLATIITVVYLVSFANIINLLDGMDGLAAGVSGIAAVSLLVLAGGANQLSAAVIAAGVIGICIGFLFYNFNPASIIMGDQGALTLGFLLGIVSLMGVMKTTAAIALAVPLLIVGVPIFDTASAIVRRIRSNRPIKEGDRGHIHHRLLGRGFNQRQTVLIIYGWSIFLGIGGYAVRYAPVGIRAGTIIVLFVVTALISYWLGIFESAHHHDGKSRFGK